MAPPSSATHLSVNDLADALLNGARGSYNHEAAVELLIGHTTWLRRGDARRWINYADDPDLVGTNGPMASFDWAAVVAAIDTGIVASSGELQVLQCAAGLAGHGHWPLDHMINSLDVENTRLLLDAIAHCRGWHEKAQSATITGHP